MFVFVAIIFGLLWCFYKYWVSSYSYWKNRGIPFHPGKFPYGSHPELVKFRNYRGYIIDKFYNEFAHHAVFGVFSLRSPILIVRDPELIKLILTKEFSHFRDRALTRVSEDDVLNHNLFTIQGDKWRALRMKLSPTFTSGKIKRMFSLFIKCAESYNSLLESHSDSKVNIKKLAMSFTSDVIWSCAFGLEGDSYHRLRSIATERLEFTFLLKLKSALLKVFPGLSSLLPIRMFPLESEKYAVSLINNIVEQREKTGISRNDFIDLLMQLRNKGSIGEDGNEFEMTLECMTAQCLVFFLGGFESSSSIQSLTLYELALRPDLQSRLFLEINEKIKKNGGLTYNALQEMEYLDMVVSETLRRYPTIPILTRVCNKAITLPGGYKIDEGTPISIPVYSLHHDAQYFPEPQTFDPERFSQERINSIVPGTYLPFGEGPRICIGMKFGLIQTKVGIVTLLQKYEVEPCEETAVPLVMGASTIVSSPEKPIIIKLKPRS